MSRCAVLQLVLAASVGALGAPVDAKQTKLGWVENVYVLPWGAKIKAKLDTGARTSSIHVEDIELFDKDDEQWVRFVLPIGEDRGYDGIEVERPLLRKVRIKRPVGESRRRYVVTLDLCLDGRKYSTPVTLADRDNFNYPMLLGRRTLKDHVVVDPGRTFLSKRKCKSKPSQPAAEADSE